MFCLSTVPRQETPLFTLANHLYFTAQATSLPYLSLSLCPLNHVSFGFWSVFPAKGWSQHSTEPVHYTARQHEAERLTEQAFTTAQRADAVSRVIYFLQPLGPQLTVYLWDVQNVLCCVTLHAYTPQIPLKYTVLNCRKENVSIQVQISPAGRP